jgi:hypothetical protein
MEMKTEELYANFLKLQMDHWRAHEAGRVQRERAEEQERELRTGYFERQGELNSPGEKLRALRDHCAMNAINAILYATPDCTPGAAVARAFEVADAFLKARGK